MSAPSPYEAEPPGVEQPDPARLPPPGFSISAADLQKCRFPPLRWIAEPFLAEGTSIVAGKRKLGKSALLQSTAIAVAKGGLFLGKFPTDQGNVLYYDLENGRRRVRARLERALGSSPWPAELEFRFEAPQIGAGLEEDIRRWCDDVPNPALVVIDILARVRKPIPKGQAQTYGIDYEVIRALTALAQDLRIAIVIVTHVTKASAADPFDEISGSMGLTGAADTMYVLRKECGEMDASLHINGRDIEPATLALARDPILGWKYLGDAEELRVAGTRREILDFLRREKSGTPKQIADALGAREDLIRQTLRRMYDDQHRLPGREVSGPMTVSLLSLRSC
jgi:hypothetical protein